MNVWRPSTLIDKIALLIAGFGVLLILNIQQETRNLGATSVKSFEQRETGFHTLLLFS